jgi:hypothetical protein
VEGGADGCKSCCLVGEETDVAGGEGATGIGAQEGGEVFGIAVGVIELGGGREVLVLGDANDDGPAGAFVFEEVGGDFLFNLEVSRLLCQKGGADGKKDEEDAHGESSS